MNERRCRDVVARRSDGLCERCCRQAHSFHHRKKKGQGGPWCPTNIVHLCGHGTVLCHGWIEGHPDKAAAEGFHVRPWQVPADTPVKYRGRMALLLIDGGIQYL